MQSFPPISQVAASCDWMTRTFAHQKTRDLVWSDFHNQVDAFRKEGYDHQDWSWMGYQGISIAGMSWGHREDTDILRLSGGTAERLFNVFSRYEGNCSRLDVALTFMFTRPIHHVASTAYRDVAELGEPASIRTYSLVVNSKGGETLYVGSRSSDQFGRLYDKSAEQGDEEIGHTWRYEVEFKAERAKLALTRLTSMRDRDMLYSALVHGFFDKRAVPVPKIEGGEFVHLEAAAHPRDDDVSLAWLARQVRPVVKRLVEHGRGEEVIDALRVGRSD